MTIDAEPLQRRRPRSPRRGRSGLVLHLKDDRNSPATLPCSIDGQAVPGGWGDWYYLMPPGRHQVALGAAAPLLIDIDAQPGTLTEIDVQYHDSAEVPCTLRLARQPSQRVLAQVLPVVGLLGIMAIDGLLMGGLILLGRALS